MFGGDQGLTFNHLAAPANGGKASWLRPDFVFPESGFSMEAAIDELVAHATRQADGNVSAAARLLGVSRDVVRYRLKGQRENEPLGE